MKPLLSGPKFSSRHQTVIDGAEPLLRALKDLNTVYKIVVGPVKQLARRSTGIQDKQIEAGIELAVKSGGQLQVFYVYGEQSAISEKVSAFQNQEVRGKPSGSKKKRFQPVVGASWG